ncbi:hypothetical protein LUZ63_000547 [Rhynchospora breviuscula]|uniref:Protein kinase domain-containing protein n=1 Tax=Rhynchospora breviuscula TaxID=2022672 RepID=A0A9Q0HWZ9_9POAL|nr:hypothetical protein LUZ63_000547 [Rhynchospora breviuscula]
MFWLLMFLLHVVLARFSAAESLAVGKPGCRTKCGNVEVPFPFGIDPGCSLEGFNLTCRQNAEGNTLFFNGKFEVLEILLRSSQVRMNNPISFQCYQLENSAYNLTSELNLTSTRFRISHVHNRLVAVGCNVLIYNTMVDYKNEEYRTVCVLVCYSEESLVNVSCFGIGCCESAIPPGVNYHTVSFGSISDNDERGGCFFASNFDSWTVTNFSPCSYAVLMEAENFSFTTSYVTTNDFWQSRNGKAPILMDWSISDETCKAAQRNKKNYACVSRNSVCREQTIGPGYSCNCSEGYKGNPYLVDGCQDIDECADGSNICSGICVNIPGSYICSCPPGSHNDPNHPGACYRPDHKMSIGITIAIGVSAGATLLSLVLFILVLIRRLQIRRNEKLKQKFFKQNHGLLLQRLISSTEETGNRMKIFSLEELEKATNKFDEARILGSGGHGTVYKGILSDLRVVAIKRAKTMEQSEIDQFINEVVILSQINHRNVVKLYGCCLETEVPLLVNEFISNGTLSDHLHVQGKNSLPWTDRLRIALETARAISYLHSAASMSIFHRDIKCSNILLDDYLTAKLSDFGASKSVEIDQTGITTVIQGTYGYLDPEYYYTGRLTEKSDVYSFGVILTELLTREKVYLTRTSLETGSLIARFVKVIVENRPFEILDSQIVEEAPKEQLEEVAILTERCLRLRGEERPGMKEVEVRLEVIWGTMKDFVHQPSRRSQEL